MRAPSRTPSRALALAAFGVAVVLTQVVWLTFSPITDDVARDLDVGSGPVGDLTALNPLVFVLLALPAGRLLDRRLGSGSSTPWPRGSTRSCTGSDTPTPPAP